jgi:hypothetical protein
MSDFNIKDSWDNIDEFTGIPGYGITSIDKFIKGQTLSIYGKIRRMFVRDFIIKSVGGIFILLNLHFYGENPRVMLVNLVILGLVLLMLLSEINLFRKFNRVTDPGQDAKKNLASMLTFLRRHINVPVILFASTQVFVYVPGVIFYFFLEHGGVDSLTPFSYFVFSFICTISVIMSIVLTFTRLRYHIRHIRICLSDLNDNALAQATENIRLRRNQDTLIVILVGIAVFLGFLVVIVLVKSI